MGSWFETPDSCPMGVIASFYLWRIDACWSAAAQQTAAQLSFILLNDFW